MNNPSIDDFDTHEHSDEGATEFEERQAVFAEPEPRRKTWQEISDESRRRYNRPRYVWRGGRSGDVEPE